MMTYLVDILGVMVTIMIGCAVILSAALTYRILKDWLL